MGLPLAWCCGPVVAIVPGPKAAAAVSAALAANDVEHMTASCLQSPALPAVPWLSSSALSSPPPPVPCCCTAAAISPAPPAPVGLASRGILTAAWLLIGLVWVLVGGLLWPDGMARTGTLNLVRLRGLEPADSAPCGMYPALAWGDDIDSLGSLGEHTAVDGLLPWPLLLPRPTAPAAELSLLKVDTKVAVPEHSKAEDSLLLLAGRLMAVGASVVGGVLLVLMWASGGLLGCCNAV